MRLAWLAAIAAVAPAGRAAAHGKTLSLALAIDCRAALVLVAAHCGYFARAHG
jgi:hypothetical protein